MRMNLESILNEMGKIINRDSILFQNASQFVNKSFVPIVVEYSKVVENQLRTLLGTRIPSSQKILGGVLFTISENHIVPYSGYLTDLYKVNRLRKSGAHTGMLGKNDVDEIRKILFQNNLLNLLI